MKRFRVLAAFLGCLAVLASGFMTVAAATTSATPRAQEQNAIGEQPCGHCDECGGTPCPMPTATCLQMSPNTTSTLATATFDFWAMDASKVRWSSGATFLIGLSPPPDPFPPRA